MLRFESSPAIDDVASAWASISGHLAWQPEWLRITAADPSVPLTFTIARRGQDPVAGALRTWLGRPGWSLTDPVAMLAAGAGEGKAGEGEAVGGERPDDIGYPASIYSLPALYRPGVAAGPTATDEDLTALIEHLELRDTADGARLLAVLSVPPEDRLLASVLRRRGYVAFQSTSECVLEIGWDSFEGYLQSLPSHRRRTIRNENTRFLRRGLRVARRPVTEIGARHADLISMHLASYGHQDETAGKMAARLTAILENIGERCLLLEAWGEDLVAFAIAYRDGTDLYPRVFGIDHQATAGSFAYFALGYYALIDLAIEIGVTRIWYGPESYRAKALRGCSPERRTNWVRLLPPERPEAASGRLLGRAAAVTGRHRAELIAHEWLRGGSALDEGEPT
jgi:uncharacterized protein